MEDKFLFYEVYGGNSDILLTCDTLGEARLAKRIIELYNLSDNVQIFRVVGEERIEL